MKNISIVIALVCMAISKNTYSQFITKGVIEFERKTNQHALMDDNSIWDAAAKKALPQFVVAYFDLKFDDGHTFYKTGREPDVKQNKYGQVFNVDNTVAMNLESNTAVTSKSIQGATYLFEDSIRQVDWKISTETRMIAGFECRKAVGKIFDSVVVIAFYTDEIIPSGGPESFAGLPGMILGVAIPRLHTTWYATKLQLLEVSAADLAAPKKGKKTDKTAFAKQMKVTTADWGTSANQMEWQMVL